MHEHTEKVLGIPTWYPQDLRKILSEKPAIVRAFLLSSQALRLNVFAKGLGWASWTWEAKSKRAEIYKLELEEQDKNQLEEDLEGTLGLLLFHWWQSEIKGCPPVTEVCLWENPETPIKVLPPEDRMARLSIGKKRKRV